MGSDETFFDTTILAQGYLIHIRNFEPRSSMRWADNQAENCSKSGLSPTYIDQKNSQAYICPQNTKRMRLNPVPSGLEHIDLTLFFFPLP